MVNRAPRVALLSAFFLAGLTVDSTAFAQPLPDLNAMGVGGIRRDQFSVGFRAGRRTFEWEILTADIGGQDWVRPRTGGDTGPYMLSQLYEYALYQCDDSGAPDFVYTNCLEIDRRRKPTICNIDDASRGSVFPCIQEHGPRFTCGGPNGVSRGWADSYFRGLAGQWVFIDDAVGSFLVTMELDPDSELDPANPIFVDDSCIPSFPGCSDKWKDATHTNNGAFIKFTWDGIAGAVTRIYEGLPPMDPLNPDATIMTLGDSVLVTDADVCPAL